jgi:hypothetical protein
MRGKELLYHTRDTSNNNALPEQELEESLLSRSGVRAAATGAPRLLKVCLVKLQAR